MSRMIIETRETSKTMQQSQFRALRRKRFASSCKGAALVDYGILIGAIAFACVLLVAEMGSEVSRSFATAYDHLNTERAGSSASSSNDGSDGGAGAADIPAEPVMVLVDDFDSGTPLHVDPGRNLVFIDTAPFGYTSSNDSAHHANSGSISTSGLAWLDIPDGILAWPGRYRVDLLVGNFNNKPFVSEVEVGLRSEDAFMTPTSSYMPTPDLGQTELWTLYYDVTQAQIDKGITFGIEVLYTGANENASFDDLDIVFDP